MKVPLLRLQASELGEDRAALQGRLSAFLDHNPRGTVLITNVHKARAAWAGLGRRCMVASSTRCRVGAARRPALAAWDVGRHA